MTLSLTKSSVASVPVVVDALPYIDVGYDEPGVREAVSVANVFKCDWLSEPIVFIPVEIL